MSDSVGFQASYNRHLATEQRRAVLDAIAREVTPDTTMGEILEAAENLGWADGIGALSLSQLADVLLTPAEPDVSAEPEIPAAAANEGGHSHASARARPRGSRPRKARRDVATDDLDHEKMSPERAADVLVPVIRDLGEATMQQIEARTGIGRRKLRFHIGQLVKGGALVRHGMGRGTFYTAS